MNVCLEKLYWAHSQVLLRLSDKVVRVDASSLRELSAFQTSRACSTSLYRVHGSRPCAMPVETTVISIGTWESQAVPLLADGILVVLTHVLGLCYVLVVLDLGIVWGFARQSGAVSLGQYRANGVPVESLEAWLQEIGPQRCWIYTCLGVLLLLVSIEFGIVYPWFLVLRSHVVRLEQFFWRNTCLVSLTTLDFQSFVSLLSRRICVNIFLLLFGWSDCHVLHGFVRVVLLDVRVVHEGIVPDHVVMASLHDVQRSVPIALVEVDLVSLVGQPLEGTHLAAGLDCWPNSTYFPGNRGWRATCRSFLHSKQYFEESKMYWNAGSGGLPASAFWAQTDFLVLDLDGS